MRRRTASVHCTRKRSGIAECTLVDLDLLERRLLQAARDGRPVTYGALLAFFERRVTPINVAALCRDLGHVCRRVEAQGGPDLACLVVRQSDGLPGEGYFRSLREEGGYKGPSQGPRAARFVARQQARAQAYARGLSAASAAR